MCSSFKGHYPHIRTWAEFFFPIQTNMISASSWMRCSDKNKNGKTHLEKWSILLWNVHP
jgi:hypothetical protein